ncbi:MAG TPA: hypothetical protein VHP36_04895 [Chitinispirillaceae bacterium]|nr:hypothetical protein [Chitinispirillaceae bacterium]
MSSGCGAWGSVRDGQAAGEPEVVRHEAKGFKMEIAPCQIICLP